MAQKYVAYVGSYTYYGSSKGISIMDVDVEKASFTKERKFLSTILLSCCFLQ